MKMSKSVKDQFEEAFEAAVKEDSLCPVGRLVKEHEAGPVIQAKVNDVVGITAPTISRVLKGLGLVLTSEAINKHRKGICRCV